MLLLKRVASLLEDGLKGQCHLKKWSIAPNQTFSATILKTIECLQNNTKSCQFGSPMVMKGTKFQRFKIFSPFNMDIPFFEIPHFFFWFFHVVVARYLGS